MTYKIDNIKKICLAIMLLFGINSRVGAYQILNEQQAMAVKGTQTNATCYPACDSFLPCSPNYANPCWSFNTFHGVCTLTRIQESPFDFFFLCNPNIAIYGCVNNSAQYTDCDSTNITAKTPCVAGTPNSYPCGDQSSAACQPPGPADISAGRCPGCQDRDLERPCSHSNCTGGIQ
jgi:hypothetical protein